MSTLKINNGELELNILHLNGGIYKEEENAGYFDRLNIVVKNPGNILTQINDYLIDNSISNISIIDSNNKIIYSTDRYTKISDVSTNFEEPIEEGKELIVTAIMFENSIEN